MKILYVSTLCSRNKFKKIFENSSIKPEQQAQKFHNLLKEGFEELNHEIEFISRPPVNKTTNKDVNTNEIEYVNKSTFNYLKVNERILIKDLSLFLSSFKAAFKWSARVKNNETVIICDALKLSVTMGALVVSKIKKIRSVAIITDLPYMDYRKEEHSIFGRIYLEIRKYLVNLLMNKYDYYVLLTDQMNEVVNKKDRPFVIIEGLVDYKILSQINNLSEKYDNKVIMYTGALYEKLGLKLLLDAFQKLDNSNVQLWIFGDGKMVSKIKELQSKCDNIKYFGVLPNEDIIEMQKKATLLVNPRPSDEDFTKYSFPSKNMEYMVSGTPVLTTALPGMPPEYNEYVYIIEDETVEGLSNQLNEIITKSEVELKNKGLLAKEFVLNNKNNILQAGKIIELINRT